MQGILKQTLILFMVIATLNSSLQPLTTNYLEHHHGCLASRAINRLYSEEPTGISGYSETFFRELI